MTSESVKNDGPRVADGVTLARGTAWLIFNAFVGNLFVIVYFVVVAHLVVDISELGMISFVTLVNEFGVIIFTFSIPRASVRFVAQSIASGKQSAANGLARRIILFGVMCAIIVTFILFLLGNFISLVFYGSGEVAGYLQFLVVDTAPLVFSHFPRQLLLGAQKYRTASISEMIQNGTRFTIALSFFSSGMGMIGIILGWAIGDGLGAVIAGGAVIRFFRGPRINSVGLSEVGAFSAQLFGISTSDYLVQVLERYALLLLSGNTALGLYSPAATASMIALLVPMMVTSALLPHFTGLSSGNTDELLRDSEQKASRWIFMLFVPSAFGMASLAYPIIIIIGGARYASASIPLAICAIAIGLASPVAAINAKLLGLGRARPILAANLLSILTGIILSILFIPQLDIIGAAIARAAMLLIVMGAAGSALWIGGELNLDWKMFSHAILGSTIMLIVVVICQWLIFSLYLVPIYVLVGILTYTVYLRLNKVIDAEDIAFMSEFVPEFMQPVVVYCGKLLVPRNE